MTGGGAQRGSVHMGLACVLMTLPRTVRRRCLNAARRIDGTARRGAKVAKQRGVSWNIDSLGKRWVMAICSSELVLLKSQLESPNLTTEYCHLSNS